MTNKKIVYIHQKNIPLAVADRIRELDASYDHNSLINALAVTEHQSFYSRLGKDTLPFKYDRDFFDADIPRIDPNFNKSFEQITDERCHDLVTQYFDRPWLIQWSGGIDSTVIVSSILKNLSPQQLKNITVSCNSISVFENPKFYYDWIVPNFNIINSTSLDTTALLDTYYIIDGNPADMLQGSGFGLFARNIGIDMSLNWKKSADVLIKFLSSQVGQIGAHWMYSRIEENINSLNIEGLEIEFCSDWFWWINFNWKWPADCMREMDWIKLKNLKPYFKSMINWFDSQNYQQWSIKHGRYSLLDTNTDAGNYKMPSKQYIYQLDKNEHYLRFKTKVFSNSRINNRSWLCVLDDLTTLSVDQDLDLILELLPSHLNI